MPTMQMNIVTLRWRGCRGIRPGRLQSMRPRNGMNTGAQAAHYRPEVQILITCA